MDYTIDNSLIEGFNETEKSEFPKYTSQLMNLANQNAQATRPNIVGQLSELFPQFQKTSSPDQRSINNWKQFYIQTHPDAIDKAVAKIYSHIINLREAITKIDEEMIRSWVEDLICIKTYNGMYVQKAILAFLAEQQNATYRLATPEEEAIGIDGYVNSTAYSIKPDSYQIMDRLPETINVKMIYYSKTKTGMRITVEE